MNTSLISQILLTVIMLFIVPCNKEGVHAQTTSQSNMSINITIDGNTMPVHLVDNAATRELVALLQENSITYEADDYGGFEKVGALGRSLPTSNSQLTTEAGDVILYNGNQIVLFYGSNSWSYTRLGRIDYSSLHELKTFLKAGQGRINVTLSTASTSGVEHVNAATQQVGQAYAINGTALNREPDKGLFVKNGKKITK